MLRSSGILRVTLCMPRRLQCRHLRPVSLRAVAALEIYVGCPIVVCCLPAQGVGISTDGGALFKTYDAKLTTEARYGAFPATNTWCVPAHHTPTLPSPPSCTLTVEVRRVCVSFVAFSQCDGDGVGPGVSALEVVICRAFVRGWG